MNVDELSEAEVRKLEQRLRRKARRQGLLIQKSRRRDPQAVDYQQYRIVDLHSDFVIAGGHGPAEFNMDLDEVHEYFED